MENTTIWKVDPSEWEVETIASITDTEDEQDAERQEELELSFEDHLGRNKHHFSHMKKETVPLPFSDNFPTQRYVLKTPDASKIPSQCINPRFYRFIRPVTSLDHLALLLDAPVDWRQRIQVLMNDYSVQSTYSAFCRLEDVSPEVRYH